MTRNIFLKKRLLIAISVIILIFIVICLFRDGTNYSKDTPIGAAKITTGLYREVYRIYGGGVYGGDVYTVYLTDSLSFRKYLGKMFDHEQIIAKSINQGQVTVIKIDLDKEPPSNVIDSTVYSLSDLKKESKWE